MSMEGKEQVIDQVIKINTLEWGWKLILLGSVGSEYCGITPGKILLFIMVGYYLLNRPIPFMGGRKPQEVVSNAMNKISEWGEQGTAVLDATAVALRHRLKPYLPLPPTPGRKVE